MKSFTVVKVDVFADPFSWFVDGAIVADVDIIVLRGSEKTLDGYIVDRSPFAVRRYPDAIGFQEFYMLVAYVPRTLVRVDNFRGSVLFDRLFEDIGSQSGIHTVRELPGQYRAAVPIDCGCRVH